VEDIHKQGGANKSEEKRRLRKKKSLCGTVKEELQGGARDAVLRAEQRKKEKTPG